jgi:hypothetical protein
MSGHWPPEWEDPDDGFPEESDQIDAEADVRLSELAAYLASVSAPVLPDAVEARISAALAAESATRSAETAHSRTLGSRTLGSRTLGPAPPRARVRRRRDFRATMAIGPLLVCLLLAGLGFVISRSITSGSTESTSAAAPAASSAPASAAAAAPEPVAGQQFSPKGSGASQSERLTPVRPGESPLFVVTESGTSYQRATLAEQVRATLIANGASQSTSAAVPSAASTTGSSSSAASNGIASGRAYSPPPGLLGCVLRLTNGALPLLVDRATYAGSLAYVIASSSRVWVVGLGCTAAHQELIASALLAGLSRESSRPRIG